MLLFQTFGLWGNFIDSDGNWWIPKALKTAFPVLYEIIEEVPISYDSLDNLVWKGSISGIPSHKAFYFKLYDSGVAQDWVKHI